MKIFDLHCDTVFECLTQNKNIASNDLALDIERLSGYDGAIQTFAFWIGDTYRGDNAYNHFLEQYELFIQQAGNRVDGSAKTLELWDHQELPQNGVCRGLLAIESGAALGGSLDRIWEMKKRNISIITLTWNSANEIACGVNGAGGITDFGKDAIYEMENCGITVDASHLNEISFFELCSIARKPFIASHSNAYAVYKNRRNLKDAQITELAAMGGLIGLNFYINFIGGDAGLEDMLKHVEHFLNLGCEDILAIGSDFDGAKTSSYFKDVTCYSRFYDDMTQEFGRDITDKIFFGNAYSFFKGRLQL
ncbi:MAG: membrane dipeptidase [Oscillospiraceae bacterium]|nr:membrane dipeptidase [Oscillospiraceae bacterium]